MAFPIILWQNALVWSALTITASSTEAGYNVADIKNYLPWKIWKSGTLVTGITIDIDMGSSSDYADTLGLVNHNITSEAGTIEVKADNSNPPLTTRITAYTPTYGDVELKDFASHAASRYYRITLAKGGNFSNKPFIGELWLGNKVTLPEYLDPTIDPFMKSVEGSVEHSEGGHYLGAVLRARTHRFTLGVSEVGMARSFHTSSLTSFVDLHLDMIKPFYLQLDSADNDFKKPLFLVRSNDGRVDRLAVGSSWTRLGFRCPVVEAWAETP